MVTTAQAMTLQGTVSPTGVQWDNLLSGLDLKPQYKF